MSAKATAPRKAQSVGERRNAGSPRRGSAVAACSVSCSSIITPSAIFPSFRQATPRGIIPRLPLPMQPGTFRGSLASHGMLMIFACTLRMRTNVGVWRREPDGQHGTAADGDERQVLDDRADLEHPARRAGRGSLLS